MNKKYFVPVVLMLAAVAGLAAMGLVFCWGCPDRLHDVGGVASRWCFQRQAAWNIACASGFVQHQTCEAFAQSRWFSSCETEILDSLPGAVSFSMPASSAVVFGKWFMALAWTLISFLVLALAWFWRRTSDVAMRTFIAFSGLGFVVPFFLGHGECLGLTPMVYMVVPLVSYDAAAVLASWFGVGVLASIYKESFLSAAKECLAVKQQ